VETVKSHILDMVLGGFEELLAWLRRRIADRLKHHGRPFETLHGVAVRCAWR
jgi:hypothetical protein